MSQVIQFGNRETREAFRAAVAAADGRPVTFRDRKFTPQYAAYLVRWFGRKYREKS